MPVFAPISFKTSKYSVVAEVLTAGTASDAVAAMRTMGRGARDFRYDCRKRV